VHSRVISNWNTDRHMSTAAKQCSGSVCQRYGSEDPHPDPYQNVTVPEHCYEDKNFAESVPNIKRIFLIF
jgi:hypothetical protein